jgi:galactokinase/mevalonate kinase-like predicted kinase
MSRDFATLEPERAGDWFVGCDPPGHNLGSGGGTVHLLREAWRATGGGCSFAEWLRQSPKLIVHAGGESRRLPAYAVTGKALIPMPVLRWSHGQRLDQTLLDLQQASYERILAHAPASSRVMVTSGDVLLRYAPPLPPLPAVDVLALGLWVKPELATHHGVFFCPRRDPHRLAFFLQKPSPAHIRELGRDHVFLVDVGVWLLSERALAVLEKKCGDPLRRYEMYADFGLGLGAKPAREDAAIQALTSAVVPLPAGEFYHFGTSRALIESVAALHNVVVDQTRWGAAATSLHPDLHLQNCRYEVARSAAHHTIWVENSHIPATWRLSREHVLTGVPENSWTLQLEPGVCLDFLPVGKEELCLRFYRLDEPELPAQWFAARGLPVEAGYPVLPRAEWTPAFIEWLTAAAPVSSPPLVERWKKARRLTAAELMQQADLVALAAQRRQNREAILAPLARNYRQSVFYKLDLEATAKLYAATKLELPAAAPTGEAVEEVRRAMFRAAVHRYRGTSGAAAEEARAFTVLRELIVRETELAPVAPRCRVLEDQIVWGRSPLRMDLAGGWTDTPPYCLQFGGAVVNAAVDLNGQPPIQVFARVSERPELVIRSIDIGVEERVRTFAELATFEQIGSGFTIAKAALALAGFLPRFSATGAATLEEQLRQFGGGIEVSLLSAVPKGSGLGTSSILAATLLGTLGELCGLNWSERDLFRRTLALEQLLTTGGGWQDQVGGVLHGVKLVETEPGLGQTPTVRWLPGEFLAEERVLLYYTGITRVAADILREIVRKMFLNERRTLALLDEIGEHARATADALQRQDWAGFAGAVARSWELNQALDAGTNPPAVQAVLDAVRAEVAGAKLLGAGGGGFLLLVAQDADAARRIRAKLTERPPNAKARFVGLSVSATGLQVTRS